MTFSSSRMSIFKIIRDFKNNLSFSKLKFMKLQNSFDNCFKLNVKIFSLMVFIFHRFIID